MVTGRVHVSGDPEASAWDYNKTRTLSSPSEALLRSSSSSYVLVVPQPLAFIDPAARKAAGQQICTDLGFPVRDLTAIRHYCVCGCNLPSCLSSALSSCISHCTHPHRRGRTSVDSTHGWLCSTSCCPSSIDISLLFARDGLILLAIATIEDLYLIPFSHRPFPDADSVQSQGPSLSCLPPCLRPPRTA